MKKTGRNHSHLLFMCVFVAYLSTALSDQIEGKRFAGIEIDQQNLPQLTLDLNSALRDSIYSFPAPDTWPSGLAWDGTNLWLAGLTDQQIYKLTPEGEILGTLSGPDGGLWAYPAGLTWDGEYLWVVEEEGAVAYQADTEADTIVQQFNLPSYGEYDANAWGIAWDGEYLWHSQYDSDAMIFKIDPSSGAVISSFIPPVNFILGLGWKNGILYGVDISSLTLYSFDTSSGAVLDTQPWEIPYPLGFLWDGDYFWNVSSKIEIGGNQRVYKLSLDLPPHGLGLVGKYLFSGDAFDHSGHGNHGLVIGPDPVPDRFGTTGSAFEFDGIDDLIDLGDARMLLLPQSPLTISSWIFPNEYGEVTQSVFGCSRNDAGFSLAYEPTSSTFEALLGDTASFTTAAIDTLLVPVLDWSHVLITWSPEDSLRLYVDGELEAVSDRNNWSYSGAYLDHLFIGADESETLLRESSSFFDGVIDDVYIYDRVLSPLEVDSLYHINKILMNLGEVAVHNGESFLVPINVIFPDDSLYTSAEIHFQEYMAGFEFVGVVTDGSMLAGLDWDIVTDETEAELQLNFSGSTAISGEGLFCYIEFSVVGEVCTSIPLSCDYARFDSNHFIEEMDLDLYINPIALFGDFNLDHTVDSADANDLLTYLQVPGILDCQEILNADVFLDENVQSMDAAIILGHLEGRYPVLPIIPGSSEYEAAANLTLNDVAVVAGDSIEIPFLLTEAANIQSFRATISYDPDILIPTEDLVVWSPLLDDFMIIAFEEPGLIELFGAGALPVSEDGVFVTLNFGVRPTFIVDNSTLVSMEYVEFNANHELFDISALITSLVGLDDPAAIPQTYSLAQNCPNPFNPSTTLRYGLPEDSEVSLIIYDIRGNTVRTIDSGSQIAGWYEHVWNGMDEEGQPVSTGLYLARLRAGSYTKTIKMLYLK